MSGIALYPRWVKLFFGQGALLSNSDPNKLLQGSGKTVRHVVLNSVAEFDRAEIEVLMAAALKLAKLRRDPSAKSSVIIKAEAQKQRARRALGCPSPKLNPAPSMTTVGGCERAADGSTPLRRMKNAASFVSSLASALQQSR